MLAETLFDSKVEILIHIDLGSNGLHKYLCLSSNRLGLISPPLPSSKLLPWEVAAEKANAKAEADEAFSNPQQLLQDLCHTAAFGASSPLGQPLMVTARGLPAITPEALNIDTS